MSATATAPTTVRRHAPRRVGIGTLDELVARMSATEERPVALHPADVRLLRTLAGQIEVALSAIDGATPSAATGADTLTATVVESLSATEVEPLTVTYYQANDSVFFDDEYVIKGAAGRILWKLMREHATHGRVHFTNRELRLDERLELPAGNDNLDSRLVTLRRRLAGGSAGVKLTRVGRGRLELRLPGPVSLTEVPTEGPMRRNPMWPPREAVSL